MMRTLRRILAIARKELLVLMGTRQSRFMVLIPPVIQIFIFAWAATMEVKNVDVVVINEDSGTGARRLSAGCAVRRPSGTSRSRTISKRPRNPSTVRMCWW